MADEVFDPTLKFVRVIEVKNNGMVEFEFSVGDPGLYVELILPALAFRDFCLVNQVVASDHFVVSPDSNAAVVIKNDVNEPLKWSLHSARTSWEKNN